MTLKTNKNNLVHIALKKEDLLFYRSLVESVGGVENARELLVDIINRYFSWEYFDEDLLEAMGITTQE